jgi:repressor LexA
MGRLHAVRAMTDHQRAILDFITEQVNRNGYPPTLREIGAKFSIGSTNGVRCQLIAIERKGFIRRRPNLSRGIELTHPTETPGGAIRVPIVGRIAAGLPILAVENLEGEILLDKDFFPFNDGFALRVKGRSMIDAGIIDGDVILARSDMPLEPGSIVVAVIGEEATVKRYYPEPDRVRLEPANPQFGPIIVEHETPGFRIAGRVVGLYRRY